MEKQDLNNIPGLNPEDKVIVWKMNYGMRSDLQGETHTMHMEQEGNKQVGKGSIDLKKIKLLTLAYGIFEAPSLGIKPFRTIDLGMTEEEKVERLKIIRNLEPETGDFLFDKINKFGKVEDMENLKKKSPL